MPETPPNTPVEPTPEDPKLFAGKYETPQALEDAIREIRPKLGMSEMGADVPIVGEGGMYTDHAAAEQGYRDFESMLGRASAPSEPAQPPGPERNDKGQFKGKDDLGITPTTDLPSGIDEILSKAGLDGTELGKQYAEHGTLTEDQYTKLGGAGFSKGTVNDFMAGQVAIGAQTQAVLDRAVSDAESVAGGAEQLNNLRAWAAQNMDAARLDALSKNVESNPAFYPDMIRLVQAEYGKAVGSGGGVPVVGGEAPATTSHGYTDQGELMGVISKIASGEATDAELMRYAATDDEVLHKLGR